MPLVCKQAAIQTLPSLYTPPASSIRVWLRSENLLVRKPANMPTLPHLYTPRAISTGKIQQATIPTLPRWYTLPAATIGVSHAHVIGGCHPTPGRPASYCCQLQPGTGPGVRCRQHQPDHCSAAVLGRAAAGDRSTVTNPWVCARCQGCGASISYHSYLFAS